jgi:stage II sporulation protein E
MGILEEVDFYKEKKFLAPGDIIVSVTDGVVDSKRDIVNKEFWISGFLKGLDIDEPQIIAEELLAKTVENYGGNILDDVTIIVQKIA